MTENPVKTVALCKQIALSMVSFFRKYNDVNIAAKSKFSANESCFPAV